jgi:hypothetical protein
MVSYDLNAPGQKYDNLIEEIKSSLTQAWAKPLESLFLIQTTESVGAAYERFKAKLDANDEILVMKICRPHQGWLDKQIHDWINNHVPYCG